MGAAALRLLRLAFRGGATSPGQGAASMGASFTLDTRRFERDLKREDRTHLHRARVRALTRLASGFREDAANEIRARGLVDRGRLVQGLAERVNPLKLEARIVGTAKHTRPVLAGRRPGARMPPIKPLQRWARRKLGVPAKEARGVAFLIARAIQRRGIPPQDFVSRPFGIMVARAPRVLAEEYRRSPNVR